MFVKADNLSKDPDIIHGFFGRQGGVSRGVYESLNCKLKSDDAPEAAQENRRHVVKALGRPDAPLITLWQEHSAKVHIIDSRQGHDPETFIGRKGDALVTDMPRVAIGILTADCAPVLFCGKKQDGGTVIGAAHAGWKGALNDILEETVHAMKKLGAQAHTIQCAIGPCIAKESYEVKDDFRNSFLMKETDAEMFFKVKDHEHYTFDLAGYCHHKIKKMSIDNIYIIGIDTYMNKNHYFSYRSSCHAGLKNYGCQISTICIVG